jgi:hypothetical protein
MSILLNALGIAGLIFSITAQAQTADSKLDWATKAVALQQGPELDRLIGQLAESSAQELVQSWGAKLSADVPKTQVEKAAGSLNVELKKYHDEVSEIIKNKVNKASTDGLIPAYMERFSLDELRQLVVFFESSAVKKYQATAPELGNIFINQLIVETRADVFARAKIFDNAATKIVSASAREPNIAAATVPDKNKPIVKK